MYLAKNTFKVGISTNLPVWLLTDIQYSPINGQISFASESFRLFTSFANLKSYVKRNVDSYSFWSKFFLVISALVFVWSSYRIYKKSNGRREHNGQAAEPAAN